MTFLKVYARCCCYLYHVQASTRNTTLQNATVTIRRKQLTSLINDNVKSAEILNLTYVSDKQPGITRVKKGDVFIYKLGKAQVRDKEILSRIKSLVLPPAWQQVWICTSPGGHIQATGIDARGRKQYRYHHLWIALRKQTKFVHLRHFGENLPKIRARVKADLALSGLPRNKVLAAVVSLMENTGIRIGSSFYEKLYGSFGLTTLKDKHVAVNGEKITFSFKGKKGVYQDITLKSRKLAHIVKQCRDIPGKELFQYYDDSGARHCIDSGMVNAYIKEICGNDFTAKDFRTWVGTVCALEALIGFDCCESAGEANRKINEALDIAARRLGNTRTVCRKYYVHPVVLDCYANNSFARYVASVSGSLDAAVEYSNEELVLMKILSGAVVATVEVSPVNANRA